MTTAPDHERPLLETFIDFLRLEKGYPAEAIVVETGDTDHIRPDITLVDPDSRRPLALVGVTVADWEARENYMSRTRVAYRKGKDLEAIPFIVVPGEESDHHGFVIYWVETIHDPEEIPADEFPGVEERRRFVTTRIYAHVLAVQGGQMKKLKNVVLLGVGALFYLTVLFSELWPSPRDAIAKIVVYCLIFGFLLGFFLLAYLARSARRKPKSDSAASSPSERA